MKFTLKLLLLSLVLTPWLYAKTAALEQVSLEIFLKNEFESAGFYMAQKKGFYKEAGLDVTFIDSSAREEHIESVVNAKSDFGIAYSEHLITTPYIKDIVVLAAILQSSPHILITLKSSDIKSIKEFKNRKIMISKSQSNAASFVAMLRTNGISLKDLDVVEPKKRVKTLIEGGVDIITADILNEPYILDKLGVKYNIWNSKDYGFNIYNDILFTSKKMLKEEPKKVEKFRDASLRGWEYAFKHIDESVDFIFKHYNREKKSKEALYYEAYKFKELASNESGGSVGVIDKNRAQRVIDIYNLLGVVKHPLNVENIIYKRPLENELSEEQKEYIGKRKSVTMCIDPDFMPYEKLENGRHIGITAEFFHIFREFLKMDIVVVPTKSWQESLIFAKERKCDILSMLIKTPSREKYLNFTEPYLKIPIVMATKINTPFVADFATLKDKKIAVPKGYAFIEILKMNYPNLEVVEVKNIEDGLSRVKRGELYGYVGTLATVAYAFQKNFTGELKIAGKFDGTRDMRIGVRDDDLMLLSIFQKAIKSLDPYTKERILHNWLSIKYEKGVDYNLAKKLTLAFVIIILVILFFYIKLTRLKKSLEYYASKDPLTDLYNRRYFTKISESIFHLAKRNHSKFSILMLDIDNFKRINDTYGHKVGDDVIVALSNVLQQHSRSSDIVCRFGGEEFILLLPDTDKEGAFVIAQKIRKLVEELKVADGISFRVSIGVSELDIENDRTIEDVIKRADDALYSAKNSGKNRVVKV